MHKITKPVVIAHRGASAYTPEHTLEAYKLAAEMGADFLEPDLVFTKDGHLVCRHENEISGTTNISEKPEFADRKTTKLIDGEKITGWFTEDFTLAEIKTLKCRERLPQLRPFNMKYNDLYEIPTFEELLAYREYFSKKTSLQIGVYPETKHPSYFESIGFSFDEPLIKSIEKFGLNKTDAPIYIQSFESENLKRLRNKTPVKLVQLMAKDGGPFDKQTGYEITYREMSTPQGLRNIAKYADGIGPEKAMIVPVDANGYKLPPTNIVADAHDAELVVHPWTLRAENYFMAKEYRNGDNLAATGNLEAEIKDLLGIGVDGVFSDNADYAYRAITDFNNGQK